jgi:glyoxylate/succinic semialdehyde reductase
MASKVGFIGVGIMGKGMLANLCKKTAGTTFYAWNRSGEVVDDLSKEYPNLVRVSNAKDVIDACDVTYSMLSTLEASRAVFDGPNGVVASMTAGKTLVDCATLTPERMNDIASRVASNGGSFLEAPVSGSKGPAETGTLIFLCGGEEKVFDEVKWGFDAMGKASFHFGEVGQGSKVKLIVNMIMGTMLTAFSEGVALCDAATLPVDKLLQVLDLGAMANPMFKMKGPNMISGEYATNFPLKHAQKDMRFAMDLGDQLGVSMPTTAAANELYKKARNEHGDEDFSAVYTAIKKSK